MWVARPQQLARHGRGHWLATGLALWLAALCVFVPLQADASVILDLASYRQVIQSSLNSLQSDPGTATSIAGNLSEIVAVRMPDQSTIEPDLHTIIDNLNGPHPNVVTAEATLSAILTQLDRAQATEMSAGQAGAASASLRSILARREFQPVVKSPVQNATEWVNRQVSLLLARLLEPFIEFLIGLVGSAPLFWTIATSIVGVIVVLAVVIGPLRAIRRGFGPATARMATSFNRSHVTAIELREEAETLARNHAYRLAIRTLYLAALVSLDEQGALTFERSLTNREVLRAALARGGAGLSERLAPLVDRFDQDWYGSRNCTEADYQEFARLADWAWEAT